MKKPHLPASLFFPGKSREPRPTLTEQQLQRREALQRAVANAKQVLRPGDRLRVTKCPGTKRTITFAGWDGNWIVSKSGIDDYSAGSIDRLNGKPINFTKPLP